MSEIICKDITLGYDEPLVVDLSFEIEKGDYICIVGDNGAGKSTLMKTLLHLQKPMSGEIIYDEGLKPTEIGYLPQQTLVQKDFPASVWEIVLSGCQSRLGRSFFYSKEDKQRAKKNMEKLGILDFSKKCYKSLSGGQQQRVLLARALCATERVLLLDEPVSGLDPKVTASMYGIISKLNEEGITIIMISHDITCAINHAGKILHLGSDTFFGSAEEYKKSELGQRYFEKNHHHGPSMFKKGDVTCQKL